MRTIKILITLILTLALLIPMATVSGASQFGDYQIFPNEPVCAGYVSPIVDGEISNDEGWSDYISVYAEPIDPNDPTHRSDKTTAVNFAPTTPDVGIDSKVYFGYDGSYFYFSADIDKFGIDGEYLNAPSDLSSENGFTGDVFTLTVDPLSKLSENSANYTKLAPRYYVIYDAEGNAAVYRDPSADNLYNSSTNRDNLFTEFDLVANKLEESDVKVAAISTGDGDWSFEAAIKWDVIIADMYANAGVDLTVELANETYDELIYSNGDWRASVIYRYCGFDIESGEYYTSAIYTTVNDSTLTGVPGQNTDGISIDTFGLVFYVCHEHIALINTFINDDDMATFEKDGVKSYVCGECKQVVKTEIIPKVPFTDVKAGAWYESALLRCYNYTYFKGTSATTFAPNMSMTRAMFVQVLLNWYGIDASEYECNFNDVKESDWYYDAVAWASSTGVTSGTSATKFSPNAPITREQAATFFMNFAKSVGNDVTPSITEFEGYVDADKVSDWAKPAMLWAVENGVISSTSKDELVLSPKTTANRITAAQMICNYLDWIISLIPEI